LHDYFFEGGVSLVNKIPFMGILGLLVLVLAVSGCTSNAGSFNKSGMSFNFPGENYTVNEVNTTEPMTVTLNNTNVLDGSMITISKYTNVDDYALASKDIKAGMMFSNTTNYNGLIYNFTTNYGSNPRLMISKWSFEKNGNYYIITDYTDQDSNTAEMIMRTLN